MIAIAVAAYLLGALGACCVLWPALRAAREERDAWHDNWRDECDRHDATIARLAALDAAPPAVATWDAAPAQQQPAGVEMRRIEQAVKMTFWLN